MSGADRGWSSLPRLYRDPERRWIAGVCAGIAAYFDLDVRLPRLLAVICLIFFFPLTLLAYVLLALLLKPQPDGRAADPEEAAFRRGVALQPGRTLAGLRRQFGALETRLQRIETLVTTEDFALHRSFRDLEANHPAPGGGERR